MIIEKILAQKKTKISMSAPISNWASKIGHPCERMLVYLRTVPEKMPVHTVSTQTVFDEGNMHERAITQDLLECGIDVFHSQLPFELKPYNIRGKIDFKVRNNGGAMIVEFKSITEHIFKYINKPEDFFKYWWTVVYPGQLTCYMLSEGATEAMWLIKNRGTGALKEIPYKLDPEFGKELCRKAERVNRVVDFLNKVPGNTEPLTLAHLPNKLNDHKFCDQCPFVAHCCPDLSYDGGVGLIEDKELEELLEKREELRGYKKEYDKIDKDVKSRIKGCDSALIGRFHVSGKMVKKNGYEVKPGEYWLAKIEAVE